MLALLFDRKSLVLTGLAVGGLGTLLFAAGFVLGVTARSERQLAPPYWLQHGPVLPGEAQAANGPAPAAPSVRASPQPGGDDGGADGRAAEGAWVPFARPEELDAGEDEAPADAGGGGAGGGGAGGGGIEGGGIEGGEPSGLDEGAAEGGGDSGPAGAAAPRVPPPRRPLWDEPEPAVATVTPTRPEPGEGRAAAAVLAAVPELAPEPTPAPELGAGERAALDGAWYVQTGAYSVPANARDQEAALAGRFAGEPYSPYVRPVTDRRGRTLLIVRVGPFPSRDEAVAVAASFDDVLVGREAP